MRLSTSIVACSMLLLAVPSRAFATAETDLAKASGAGQAVFLIVTESNATGVDVARKVAAEAQQIATGTAVVEMDRADPANQPLVKRYRLESVPVPLILVVASNGVAVGGARAASTTAVRLAAMIPSPAKAAYLKALEEKKAPLLVFTRASMPERAGALKAATDAVTELKGAAAAIEVDLDAAVEATFVKEINVDVKTTHPWVTVYNAKGQPTGTYIGVPRVADVVAAATKEVASSCCPGGHCGPNGCK